ncbi:hypothetical protein Q1695_000221 [Nippostrongylus brasiliensis]|nr:hypothetical protein Q1695_000221 [Nippostrongylus brasiliensis]
MYDEQKLAPSYNSPLENPAKSTSSTTDVWLRSLQCVETNPAAIFGGTLGEPRVTNIHNFGQLIIRSRTIASGKKLEGCRRTRAHTFVLREHGHHERDRRQRGDDDESRRLSRANCRRECDEDNFDLAATNGGWPKPANGYVCGADDEDDVHERTPTERPRQTPTHSTATWRHDDMTT